MLNIAIECNSNTRGLSLETDIRILVIHNILDAQMDEAKSVALPVRWVFPDGLQAHFSDTVMIQFSPPNQDADHFILSFFQMRQPIVLTENENERKKEFESIGHIDAVCVAQAILTPQEAKKLVAALNTNLERFEDIRKVQK